MTITFKVFTCNLPSDKKNNCPKDFEAFELFENIESHEQTFLNEMTYEAVFWRDKINRPSIEEALQLPFFSNIIDSLGERFGDIAAIAYDDEKKVGAAYIRLCEEQNAFNGFIHEDIPIVVIAIKSDYQGRGIGISLMETLFKVAAMHDFPKLSRSVAKDNYALKLYRRVGFSVYEERDDSFLMLREINTFR
ncbi:MAG: hypothetical protein BGO41_15065 [Clostridiales bacterium 38-18]|nr:MAG: hypothetical protein BGO41_15065 [Clostridiales bacterium 38-18]